MRDLIKKRDIDMFHYIIILEVLKYCFSSLPLCSIRLTCMVTVGAISAFPATSPGNWQLWAEWPVSPQTVNSSVLPLGILLRILGHPGVSIEKSTLTLFSFFITFTTIYLHLSPFTDHSIVMAKSLV